MAGVPTQESAPSGTNAGWNPLDWFADATSAAGNWLGGLGGDIASGLEGGFIATLTDTFKWLIGWLEITIGVSILLLVFMWIMKDELQAMGMGIMKGLSSG